jgi:hypothetical protein
VSHELAVGNPAAIAGRAMRCICELRSAPGGAGALSPVRCDRPLRYGPRVGRPVLTDAGQSEGEFGQLVLAGATIADLGSVILLSLFFSGKVASARAEAGPGGQFLALAAAMGLAAAGAG